MKLFIPILPLMLQRCFQVLEFLTASISPVVPDKKKILFMAKMPIEHTLPSPNTRVTAMESQSNPLMPETPLSASIHQVLNVL